MGPRGERVTADTEHELVQRLAEMARELTHWVRTDVGRAQALIGDMMRLCEGAGPLARALAMRAQGTGLRLAGKPREALRALREAQRLAQEAGDEYEWARTVIGTIPVWVQLARYKEAAARSEAALAVFVAHGELLAGARLLSNIGAMYGHMGRPRAALEAFSRGETMAGQVGDAALQARLQLHQALALQQLGRHRDSLAACARALRYPLRAGQHVTVAKILQSGAIALYQMGRFGKALRRFARARATFAEASAPRDVAVCDLYVAACYMELNRYDQALSRARSVLEVLDPKQYGFQHAWVHLYEGVALARMGECAQALQWLTRAFRWFDGHGHKAWAGKAKLEEADVLLGEAEPNRAIRAATTAARLFRAEHMLVEAARADLLAAEGSFLSGRTVTARAVAERAHRLFVRARVPGPSFRCSHLLGRIAMRQRRWDDAQRLLNRAVQTAERVRAAVQVSFRQAFLDDKTAAYADLVWLHLQRGQVARAHRLADLAKARGLVDLLSGPASPDRTGKADDTAALLAEIEAVRREYQALTAPPQFGPEEPAMLRGGAETLTQLRTRTEHRLAALWDEWELRQAGRVKSAAEAVRANVRWHRLLPAAGAMVEYFLTGSGMVAFVSNAAGLQGWVQLGESAPVRRALELLQLNFDMAQSGTARCLEIPPGVKANARSLLGQLHAHLWAPLADLLGSPESVVVVPHGLLHMVPFEALFDGSRHLVEHTEITLAPSRTVWAACLQQGSPGTGRTDLVLGYSMAGALPHIDTESAVVGDMLGVLAVTGREATVGRLEAARDCRILHMAVHGEFRRDNASFSTLQLADGRLTVTDAARLRLKANLVVLSGCETGLSRVTAGDELIGMISAFLQAGSASVLASRWRVDDRLTAELMRRFYGRLTAHGRKAAALREAQAEMAGQGLHPMFWAAFTLAGHGGPLA